MIIQNLLSDHYSNELKEIIDSDTFPYFYQENQIFENNIDQIFGFTHCVYKNKQINSNVFELLMPLINEFSKQCKIKVKNIFRLQVNLSFDQNVTKEILKNKIHRDVENIDGNFITFIYYVIDSDGDTIIYNEDLTVKERASPIQNNCVYFNSRNLHEPNLPKKHKKRIVINCVLEVEDDRKV
jgi:hypothetical protein